ncbi:hypothetical protein FOT42_009135 [Flagellimonas hadalis]|uniref:Uncharacterized protein n=1 Tax=Flagellimonas hadalis TaxID=2597517 RepID=A0A5N5IUL3_9FLAO|nr:hypothetical protein FOT42_009135 [Allomuricauda hadalis]
MSGPISGASMSKEADEATILFPNPVSTQSEYITLAVPGSPCSPCAPGSPCGPAGPAGPCAPCGPVAPSSPSSEEQEVTNAMDRAIIKIVLMDKTFVFMIFKIFWVS